MSAPGDLLAYRAVVAARFVRLASVPLPEPRPLSISKVDGRRTRPETGCTSLALLVVFHDASPPLFKLSLALLPYRQHCPVRPLLTCLPNACHHASLGHDVRTNTGAVRGGDIPGRQTGSRARTCPRRSRR